RHADSEEPRHHRRRVAPGGLGLHAVPGLFSIAISCHRSGDSLVRKTTPQWISPAHVGSPATTLIATDAPITAQDERIPLGTRIASSSNLLPQSFALSQRNSHARANERPAVPLRLPGPDRFGGARAARPVGGFRGRG